ncbi:MAG: protein BatD [Oligoflexales bacterium]|nr:protein BatD [Oligoflexales bacterium]
MKQYLKNSILLLILALGISDRANAANLQASISPSEGDVGTTFQLTLQVQGELNEEIEFPKVPGLTLLGTSHSSQISYINGRRTSSIAFIYSLKAEGPGDYTVPPIEAKINGSTQRSNATKFTVEKPSDHVKVKGSNLPGAFVQRNYSSRKPFVGEAVLRTTKLFFRIKVVEENRSISKTDHTRFFSDIDKEMGQETFSGQRFSVLSYNDVIVPGRSGTLNIPSDYVSIGIQLQSSRRSRGSFFGELFDDAFSQRTTKTLSTKEDSIEVQSLPSQGKPSKFSGLVGSFKTTADLSIRELKQGETATLTIEVEGRGLLDTMGALPLVFDENIKIYPDKPVNEEKVTKQQGIWSKRVYKFALVPNQAGELDLGTFELPVFNPDKESYEVLKADLGTLQVMAAPEVSKVVTPNSPERSGLDKTEVESLTRDFLVDIHRNFDIETQTGLNSTNRTWLYTIAGLAPFLFCLNLLMHGFLSRSGQPNAKQRRSSALRYFNLDKQNWEAKWLQTDLSTEAIESYYRIYKDFLGNKFNTNGSALTGREIERICDSLALSEDQKSNAKEIVKSMDQLAFSDGLFSAEQGLKLISKMDALISEIDRHVP